MSLYGKTASGILRLQKLRHFKDMNGYMPINGSGDTKQKASKVGKANAERKSAYQAVLCVYESG